MLYKRVELNNLSFVDKEIPMDRYMYKFILDKKNFKRLKFHEKDFFFKSAYILRDNNDKKAFNLYKEEFAFDFVFYKLILIYYDNINFVKSAHNAWGKLTKKEVERDRIFLLESTKKWQKILNTKKGIYCSHIFTELDKKIKCLNELKLNKSINNQKYIFESRKVYWIAFHIYYKVNLFFDEFDNKYVSLVINDYNIVINIFTFVHILFRHYYPSLDIINDVRSLNDTLDFLDIENLPTSLKDFLELYFNHYSNPLIETTEYILFSYKDIKYIVWLKYKKLDELAKGKGFGVRTLYKCTLECDLIKFDGKIQNKINSELSYYF